MKTPLRLESKPSLLAKASGGKCHKCNSPAEYMANTNQGANWKFCAKCLESAEAAGAKRPDAVKDREERDKKAMREEYSRNHVTISGGGANGTGGKR